MSEYCIYCDGTGKWETECCNGSGGCSCRGQRVPMGRCNVCGGSGIKEAGQDERANVRSIEGYCFVGTGPSAGWAGAPRMYRGGRP